MKVSGRRNIKISIAGLKKMEYFILIDVFKSTNLYSQSIPQNFFEGLRNANVMLNFKKEKKGRSGMVLRDTNATVSPTAPDVMLAASRE